MITVKDTYQKQLEAQLIEWEFQLESYRNLLNQARTGDHTAYHQELDRLSMELAEIQQHAHHLDQTSNENWQGESQKLEHDLRVWESDFNHLVKELETYGRDNLGWVSNITQASEDDSEGWAEGQGRQEFDSEGWAQGQGHKELDSEGWAQGQGHRELDSEGWAQGQQKETSNR